MGYEVYVLNGRDCGYGVPALCDHPDCDREIDRGLAYLCGDGPGDPARGCGLFFCKEHLTFGDDCNVQLCERCLHPNEVSFEPKPDIDKWVQHKLTHDSWAKWRTLNTEWVASHAPAI